MRFNENILYSDNNNAVIKTFHSRVQPTKRIYNQHHHTECELSLFISGSGIYSVNQKSYPFHPGDMFIFRSNEAHCITEIHDELNLLNIHFEPRILWEHSENIELLNLFAAQNKNFSNKLLSDDLKLKKMLLETENELIEKKPCFKIQVKYTIFSALVHILREYEYAKPKEQLIDNLSSVENLKKAMIYIDNNLKNKLSLHEIASIAYMSPTYFSSVFKKFNGISPWEYITIKRVEMAIEMLKSGNMTKLEIAEECGFSSSSNFYKAFANITGKKPGEYVIK